MSPGLGQLVRHSKDSLGPRTKLAQLRQSWGRSGCSWVEGRPFASPLFLLFFLGCCPLSHHPAGPHSPCRHCGPSPEPCPTPSPAADTVPGSPPPSYLGEWGWGRVSFTSRALPGSRLYREDPKASQQENTPGARAQAHLNFTFPSAPQLPSILRPNSCLAQDAWDDQGTKYPIPCLEPQACGCWAHQPLPCTS